MELFLVVICFFASSVSSACLRIKTEEGNVVGTTYTLPNGRVVQAFYGIPFAKPPIGHYRFQEPRPVTHWSGAWNATYPRSECVQFSLPRGGKEDCLYLNVYRPHRSKKHYNNSLPLDVLVYIHGGAFMFGSGSKTYPEYIMQEDIIFVTMNYRLGPLGFFSTNDSTVPGNNGLKDQVAALQWVQRNIRHFGGDPGKVTIYGLSAGAACIHYHLLSPLSEGLFQKAISSSGSALQRWSLPPAAKNSFKLASLLKCPTGKIRFMMRCLKRKSTQDIFRAEKQLSKWKDLLWVTFGPVVEPRSRTAFLSERPYTLMKDKKIKKVPWLIGVAGAEGSIPGFHFATKKEYLKELDEKWNEIAPKVFDYDYLSSKSEQDHVSSELRKFYLKNDTLSDQTIDQLIQAFGDRNFYNGISKAAKLHASATNENTTYCYKLDFQGSESFCHSSANNTKKRIGTCHADDQFYLVNFIGRPLKRSKSDEDMSKFFIPSILAFMKSGNPNIGVVEWKPVASNGGVNCLDIYSPTNQKMEDLEDVKTFQFWDNLLSSEFLENHAIKS